MKNIVLFGGSFDPIHNGHLEMAKKASTLLNAEVLFIPAVVSIWKEESCDFIDKVNMIKLAIKDENNLSISTYEATTGNEYNYSIDTIRYFKNKYEDANLYFLIGADQVNEFHRWKEAEEISRISQIVYFKRPDITSLNENVDKFHMLELTGVFSGASSSNVRDLVDLDAPKDVLVYICEHNLYFSKKISSYLSHERYNHSIEVAKLAYDIAKSNGLNPSKAFIAGLLHDIGKEIVVEEKKKIMLEHYEGELDLPHFAYHQFVGEYLAKTIFNIDDEDILSAIKYHATGYEEMGDLAKIIYSADKIEPTRGFDSSSLIKACMQNHIEGFKEVLEANRVFLLSKNKDIQNRLTSSCFKKYL